MTLRDRIRKLVRAPATLSEDDRSRLLRVEERLAHLETLVEGLQDSVHRDSVRHEERITAVERKTEPEALAKALSADARRRGL
jgi:hypothetical protein